MATPGSVEADNVLPPLEDGEWATVVTVTVKEKKTKPPSRYTEGTLLDDMMAASKFIADAPDLKKVLKEVSGLGTAATRHAIIETLKHHNYVEQSGNNILATAKGVAFVEWLEGVMPDLVDVGLTARWEAELAIVAEQGGGPAFQARVADNVRRMISIFQAAPPMGAHSTSKSKETPRMSDSSAPRSNKPSDKMLEFATNIAKKLGLQVPDAAMSEWDACKKFIDDNLPAYNKPSEKQLTFAKSIAEKKGVEIPAEILAVGRDLSRWIDDNK